MNERLYKPSNKFSLPAFLIMALSIAVVGSILSFLYLKIVEINPIIYLSILIAVGFGALLGVIANFFIKKYKLRNPALATIAVLIGGFIFTYFKWGLYDYWDGKKNVKDFCEGANITEEELSDNLEYYNDYLEAYDFILPEPDRTLLDVLKSPSTLINDIKYINKAGRWTIQSRPSYSSTQNNTTNDNVKGIFLLIIWLSEAAILLGIPIAMAASRTKHPFIEYENEWAQKYETPFLFANFDLRGRKDMIINSPETLFNVPSIPVITPGINYVKGVLYHSSDFNECYLSLKDATFDPKNKRFNETNVIKYLKIDSNMLNRLFEHCKISKPFTSVNNNYNCVPQYTTHQASEQNMYQNPVNPTPTNSNYVDPDEFFK